LKAIIFPDGPEFGLTVSAFFGADGLAIPDVFMPAEPSKRANRKAAVTLSMDVAGWTGDKIWNQSAKNSPFEKTSRGGDLRRLGDSTRFTTFFSGNSEGLHFIGTAVLIAKLNFYEVGKRERSLKSFLQRKNMDIPDP